MVAADEVATPTEQSAPPQQAAMPQQAALPQQAAMPQQAVLPQQAVRSVAKSSFPATCKAIADDIEKMAREYPQLINFRAVDQRDCAISYGYKTHRATTRGGWSSGVPHPDPEGIWFYIGIYDPNGPDAQSQIHMQPVVPNWWIGSRKVMFLILEGDKATPAAGAIMKVLERHGLQTR